MIASGAVDKRHNATTKHAIIERKCAHVPFVAQPSSVTREAHLGVAMRESVSCGPTEVICSQCKKLCNEALALANSMCHEAAQSDSCLRSSGTKQLDILATTDQSFHHSHFPKLSHNRIAPVVSGVADELYSCPLLKAPSSYKVYNNLWSRQRK